jgi:alkylhydroperoxidase family enzyme
VDAHSAMAMAQGFTQEEVKSILEDIDNSTLIEDKTKHLLHFSKKITRNAYKVTDSDIERLSKIGCSEEEIFEAIAVTSLFNYMDRMADALGAPVEGFQDMMTEMQQN